MRWHNKDIELPCYVLYSPLRNSIFFDAETAKWLTMVKFNGIHLEWYNDDFAYYSNALPLKKPYINRDQWWKIPYRFRHIETEDGKLILVCLTHVIENWGIGKELLGKENENEEDCIEDD